MGSNAYLDEHGSKAASSSRLTWWQLLIPPSLLSLLTLVFYYPSLRYPFQFDDLANISKKFDIRFMSWDILFSNSRWVGEVLNRLNYQMGKFDPWYYRVVNVSLHILSGLLVFALFYKLCQLARRNSFLNNHAFSLASVTAALFLLHPVQTQTVSYVIQARLEGLASLCVLGAIYLFITAYTTKSVIQRSVLLALSLFIGFVSCGTKEIVIVAPFLLLLADWFFLSQEEWSSFKQRIWFHLVFTAVIFTGLLYYLKPEFFTAVLGLKVTLPNNRGNIITDSVNDMITPLHYMISEFKVILHYLAIFILPTSLSVEYDWRLSPNFFSPDAFFPFIALVTLFGLAIYLAWNKRNSYISFGLLWFFLSIAPRSTIIPSPELICDYKTYLASVGWLFVLAAGIVSLGSYLASLPLFETLNRFSSYHVHTAALFLMAFALGSASMSRNSVWSSPVSFWEDVVKKAPTKARGHNNLGVALSEDQRFEEAIPNYLQAVKLDRFYSDPWSNLAVAYSIRGDDEKAIQSLKEAIRINPFYPEAYNNLGSLELKRKDYTTAQFYLDKALELRPYYGKAYFNLGRLYMEKQEPEKAWAFFKKATEGDMDNEEGFTILGQVSMQMKKYPEAVAAFSTAVKMGMQDSGVIFNLGNASYLAGDMAGAKKVFKHLVDTYPDDARFAYNYAETLFAEKEFTEACEHFKKIGTQVKELAQAHFRAVNCLEQLGQLDQAEKYLTELLMAKPPQAVEETAKNELQRISLQAKIQRGNGSINMSDINQYIQSVTLTNT